MLTSRSGRRPGQGAPRRLTDGELLAGPSIAARTASRWSTASPTRMRRRWTYRELQLAAGRSGYSSAAVFRSRRSRGAVGAQQRGLGVLSDRRGHRRHRPRDRQPGLPATRSSRTSFSGLGSRPVLRCRPPRSRPAARRATGGRDRALHPHLGAARRARRAGGATRSRSGRSAPGHGSRRHRADPVHLGHDRAPPRARCSRTAGSSAAYDQATLRAGFTDEAPPTWINPMPLFHIGGAGLATVGTLARAGTHVVMPGFDVELFLELAEAEQGTRDPGRPHDAHCHPRASGSGRPRPLEPAHGAHRRRDRPHRTRPTGPARARGARPDHVRADRVPRHHVHDAARRRRRGHLGHRRPSAGSRRGQIADPRRARPWRSARLGRSSSGGSK